MARFLPDRLSLIGETGVQTAQPEAIAEKAAAVIHGKLKKGLISFFYSHR